MKNANRKIALTFVCAGIVSNNLRADVWYYNITNETGRIDVLTRGPYATQTAAQQMATRDLDQGLNVGFCFSQTNGNSSPVVAVDESRLAVGFETSPAQSLLDAIKRMATMNPKPEIPEAARQHFVKAATVLKEAKDQSDYELAASEYIRARNIAPWWPDVYYNLASVREAEKKHDLAINDLKLYLASNPDDSRAAKDRLYQIQAEKDLAAKHAADGQAKKQQEAQVAQEKMRHILAGRWVKEDASDGDRGTLSISGSDGSYTGNNSAVHTGQGEAYHKVTMKDFDARGRQVSYRIDMRTIFNGVQRGWAIWDYSLSVSDDGTKLVGTCRYQDEDKDHPIDKPVTYSRARE